MMAHVGAQLGRVVERERAEVALRAGQGAGRAGEPHQVRVPRQHEPRAAHADERDHRLHPARDAARARRCCRRSSTTTSRRSWSAPSTCSALINDVLDLSKIEAGRMEVQPVEFALEPLVDQCLRTVEPMVRSGRVELVKQIEPGLPTLFSDQDKLRQILFNLLEQRRQVHRGRQRSRWPRGAAATAGRDRGRGHRHRHPAPTSSSWCSRSSGRSTAAARGSTAAPGSGLSISRRLAQLLGGDITLASTPGVGSTFTLTAAAAPCGGRPARRRSRADGAAPEAAEPARREAARAAAGWCWRSTTTPTSSCCSRRTSRMPATA